MHLRYNISEGDWLLKPAIINDKNKVLQFMLGVP